MRSRLIPILVGLGLLEATGYAWARLWSKAVDGDPIFGLDLDAYREGAIRLIATGSPYHDALIAGPIENRIQNVPIAYLYPPPIAQAFVPFVTVNPELIAAVWAILQMAALAVLLPLLYRRFGGALTATSILAVCLVGVLSYPLNFALYVGNLSGWITIGIAVMLLAPGKPAGIAAAVLAVTKLTPTVLLVPALIRRESRLPASLAAAGILVISILVAPYAWSQWVRLLPNIIRFPAATDASNLAPVAVLGALGFQSAGTVLGLTLTVMALAAAIFLGFRGSWAGAVAAATAALLFAPSTIWDHYLAILLPVLIAAWPGSDWRMRTTFVLFMVISASGWLEIEGWLPVRAIYLAAALLAAGSATAWFASRGAGARSRKAALA